MGLAEENRKDIVVYRIERAFAALEQAYSDRFDLKEDDVVPNIQPTEDFIVKVSNLAKAKLNLTDAPKT